MKSLQEADVAQEIHGKPYEDALGEAGRQQLREFARAGYGDQRDETLRLQPEDELSRRMNGWRADPKFWAPKAATAAKP